MIASKVVDWVTIGKVVAASLVASVVVATGFSVMLLGAVRSSEFRRNGRSGEATGFAVLATVGGLVVVAALVSGILVMTSK